MTLDSATCLGTFLGSVSCLHVHVAYTSATSIYKKCFKAKNPFSLFDADKIFFQKDSVIKRV